MPSRKPLQPRKLEEPANKPRRLFPSLTPGKVLLAIAVGVIITIIGCFIPRTNLSELSALKDKAIGLAENGDFAEADEILLQLEKKIPGDPFVARNLAVVRLSRAVKDQDPQKDDPAQKKHPPLPLEKLVEAAEGLLKSQPNDPASHVLAARSAALIRDRRLDVEHSLPDPFESLSRARELTPEDPAILMEIYKQSQFHSYAKNEKIKLAARGALVEAHRFTPNNLAVLIELLRDQTNLASPDPGVEATLAEAAELLRPLRPIALQKSVGKNDIEQYRQAALSAAKLKNWQLVRNNVNPLCNLVNSELMTRSDRDRVELATLEYLKHDLDSKYRPPPAAAPSALAVKFVPAPGGQGLPSVKGIKDLKLFDIDLDGRLDLIVLHENQLSVFRRGPKDEKWVSELTAELPAGMEHLIVGDLDRDIAKLPAEPKVKVPAADKKEKTPAIGDAVPGDYKGSQQYELAFPDFIVYGSGGLAIVRNQAASEQVSLDKNGLIERKLSLVPLEGEPKVPQKITTLIAIDFDHDQDLDLVFATEDSGVYLWRSQGNGLFKYQDFGSVSQLPPKNLVFTSLVQVDWDRDLDYDILMCGADESGESGPFGYLENLRHGQFRWLPFGKSMQALAGSSSLAVAELDGNVSWDVIGVGQHGTRAILTQTPAAGKVNYIHDITIDSGIAGHVETFDYDNDGSTDLLTWNARQVFLYRGLPRGLFAAADIGLQPLKVGLAAVDFGDLDGDGDQDLMLAEPDALHLYSNEGGNTNNWLQIRLAGNVNDQAIGSNNTALGTTVETFFPGRYTAQVITRQPVYIGLGKEEANLVRFIFSNGVPQASRFSGGNQRYPEKQVLHGSCPFLYTWTGEKFEFFTDCLWAAPIGLQVAEGKMAPSRAWEYLLIPGERLKEHDGTYDLQITEELWEAGYFDRVQLIAVDHPTDFEIYSNEKVGPPEIAAKKIHAVRQPRLPVSAVDQHGHDVLPLLARRDGNYARLFEKNIWQGLVEEHYLELDLGKLNFHPPLPLGEGRGEGVSNIKNSDLHPNPLPQGEGKKKLTLFLTGWIFPTNTSINVNLSQRPDLHYPKLPSLWVPDGHGGWKLAQGFMGFPGGKTKTIAVELDAGLFPPGDYRVRMVTSAEIYWDDVFFTIDEPSAEPAETPLPLLSANLHYRGFSHELPRRESAPQLYDYSQVSTFPKWAPMGGKFTHYGDVRELLTETDDCMVVLGAGDEMTLRFRAPQQPLTAGWKRDFLLYSVGWDKDCDMNTVLGSTTDPLPYNAMSSYPYPADQPFPQDEKHEEYLRKWQTREQSFRGFWKVEH